jgi:hypothetical protein
VHAQDWSRSAVFESRGGIRIRIQEQVECCGSPLRSDRAGTPGWLAVHQSSLIDNLRKHLQGRTPGRTIMLLDYYTFRY